MIKEVTHIRGKYLLNNPQNLSFLTSLKLSKNKIKTSKTNKLLNSKSYIKVNNRIMIDRSKNQKINEFIENSLLSNNKINKKIRKVKTNSILKDKNISLNCISNLKLANNRNPGNNKTDNLFLSIINNSSSNIFNSTTETSQNLKKKNNKNIFKNNYKINNANCTFSISIDKNMGEEKNKKVYSIKTTSPLKNKVKNIIMNKKNEKIPNYIISIKKIKNNFVKPLRNEYKLKNANSLDIKNKIKKLKNDIFENYKEIHDIQKNNSFIISNSNKKLSVLFLQKVKSEIDIHEINKLKGDIKKIKNKIEQIKYKTKIYIDNYIKIQEAIKKQKKEIKQKKIEINNFYENNKKVKTMIVLLHKRIIDANERIKKMDINNIIRDKSWYELWLTYDNIKKKK